MRSKLIVAICILLSIIICGFAIPSEAAEYLYHPDSPLDLGVGFDSIVISDTKRDCLNYDGKTMPQPNGATSTTFEVSIVKSREDLLQKLQRDTTFSASYAFSSAGYSESSFDQYSFSKNSLTWILRGFSTYGTAALINPRLKKNLRVLDDQTLVRRCGREIITREIKGAQAAIIYHLENLSESTVSRLERSFQAAVSVGSFSAGLKSTYQQFFQRAASASNLHLKVDAIGGPGVAALSGLVTATDDVSRVEAVISAYLAGITPGNAPGVRFFSAATLVAFADRQDAEPERQERQALIELYYADLDVRSKLVQVQRALDPNGIYLAQLDPSTVQRLSAAENQLKDADRAIRAAAEKCTKGDGCASIDSDATRIDVSFLPHAPSVKWQKTQFNIDGSDSAFRPHQGDERDITLEPRALISEVYIRPSWTTHIQGLPDEPMFTRKIWSSDATTEATIRAAGRPELSGPWRDFLYTNDNSTSNVTTSKNTLLISIRRTALSYMYNTGNGPPVIHDEQLIVTDRFGRTFTLDLGSSQCPELTQCPMDELD